jgi:hypothetical protein
MEMPYYPRAQKIEHYKQFHRSSIGRNLFRSKLTWHQFWLHLTQILALILLVASLVSPVLAGVPHNASLQAIRIGMGEKGTSAPDVGNIAYLPSILNLESGSWPTLAANPQRTSWSREEVSGNLNL